MDTKNFNVGRRDRTQRPRYGAEVDEYGFELEPDIADTPLNELPMQDLEPRDTQYEAECIGDGQDDCCEPQKQGFFARLFGKREQPEYGEYDDEEYGDDDHEQIVESEPPVHEQRPKREKRGRERRAPNELPAELPQESARPVLTFIVPRAQLSNLSRLTPLGAPARRRPAAVQDEPTAESELLQPTVPIPEPALVSEAEPIYDAEPEPVFEPEPIYDAESVCEERYEEPVKPHMSRREQRRRKRAHRFKLMVPLSHIRGVDTLTPYGKPISQKNRGCSAVPAMAAAPTADDYRDYEPAYTPEPAYAQEPAYTPQTEPTPQQAVGDEPALCDEDDGLSLPINEGFGFAPVPAEVPEVRERPRKKRLRYALGDRRISPQLARRLKPYTLPPVESAPPKHGRASVRERATSRRQQRRGRNDY